MAVGQRRLAVAAVLERLHRLAGPAELCLLVPQLQRRHLRFPERLVAFPISLAGRHGHLALRLRQMPWLLVVELVQLQQQSQPERVLLRHWASIPEAPDRLLLMVELERLQRFRQALLSAGLGLALIWLLLRQLAGRQQQQVRLRRDHFRQLFTEAQPAARLLLRLHP
jgi:hypothetical protein